MAKHADDYGPWMGTEKPTELQDAIETIDDALLPYGDYTHEAWELIQSNLAKPGELVPAKVLLEQCERWEMMADVQLALAANVLRQIVAGKITASKEKTHD